MPPAVVPGSPHAVHCAETGVSSQRAPRGLRPPPVPRGPPTPHAHPRPRPQVPAAPSFPRGVGDGGGTPVPVILTRVEKELGQNESRGGRRASSVTCERVRLFHLLPLPAAVGLPLTVRFLDGDDLGHGHGAGVCNDSTRHSRSTDTSPTPKRRGGRFHSRQEHRKERGGLRVISKF